MPGRTKRNVKIFLDSGAPSLYNKKVRKDKDAIHMGSYMKDRVNEDFSFIKEDWYLKYRDDYIAFIKKYIDYVDYYANLDIINNPEATWENQLYFEEKGLSPIPVFHLSPDPENINWLVKYIDRGHDYIAIGGMAPNTPESLIPSLDKIWDKYLTDDKGMPIVKIHGFAATAIKIITRYPWFSVDSASWVKYGRFGIVCIPKKKNGQWKYNENFITLCVSSRSPSRKEFSYKHINSLPKTMAKRCLDYFEEMGFELGKSHIAQVTKGYKLKEGEYFLANKAERENQDYWEIEVIEEPGLCNDYKIRDELNILYFLNLEKSIPDYPWAFKIPGNTSSFFEI